MSYLLICIGVGMGYVYVGLLVALIAESILSGSIAESMGDSPGRNWLTVLLWPVTVPLLAIRYLARCV